MSKPAVLPQHIAIIMDGNGRWARRRLLPRYAGHRAGLSAARATIESCVRHGVPVLTLFAFSSENWQRPQTEVGSLMELFLGALETEVQNLNANHIRIRFIGALDGFAAALQEGMRRAQQLTRENTRLTLNIAVGYGGRWDMLQAVRRLAADVAAGRISTPDIDEVHFSNALALAPVPDPDLFIRTGGERRISNFLLWNLAYTELYFTDTLWPDFADQELDAAIRWFAGRQRRFGLTPEQRGGTHV
ncbi:MAG: di-trans,poly-cis-decaprenylcistransferase [Gammaproteobacteria bacterium]|nr:di-trans,poly-cis-decaprenylcistransferase [Gammaproteobacteria bacterium]